MTCLNGPPTSAQTHPTPLSPEASILGPPTSLRSTKRSRCLSNLVRQRALSTHKVVNHKGDDPAHQATLQNVKARWVSTIPTFAAPSVNSKTAAAT
jgi:hypothetical protein